MRLLEVNELNTVSGGLDLRAVPFFAILGINLGFISSFFTESPYCIAIAPIVGFLLDLGKCLWPRS